MRDLLVAGGGPVGLATALYAHRAGLEVAVLEPRPAPIDKACGEGLMPAAVQALAGLGIQPPGRPLRGVRYLDGTHSAQALRWWCITTLGRRWNTRVIVVPGLPPVTRGPYRLFSHPNYVAVVVEGVALPLVHGAWITAAVFTVLNAALLSVRIRVENAALRTLPEPVRGA